MGETVLGDLVRDWGDFILEEVTGSLYQSGLFQTILYITIILVFLKLALDVSNGNKPYETAVFFFCWLLVMPINNRPVYYYLINTISVSTSNLFQKAMYNLLTLGNTRKVVPPGFIFNSIIKASSAEISDPSIRADIRILIDQCIPDVKNKDNKMLTAMDLFGGKVQISDIGVETIILNFEPHLLKNRKIVTGASSSDCMNLLTSTRKRLRSHLKGQDLTKMPDQIYIGPNSGEFKNKDDYVTTWDASSPKARLMGNIAVNLAEAHAIQKAILEDYFDFSPSSRAGKKAEESGALSPFSSLTSNAFSGKRTTIMGIDFDPTRIVSEIANYPTAIAKSLNLDGAIDAGFTIQEMNERLVKLPYYISNIQLVLKLVAPIIIFLLLFPKAWGFVAAWSIGWFASLVVPVILMFSRSIANMIIIWTTKLEHITAININDPAFLNVGVSFEAANNLMRDAGYWMSVFLEIENGVWNALFLGMPVVGGLIAHFKGNQFIKKIGESVSNTAGREAGRSVMKTSLGSAKSAAGTVAKGAAAHAIPYAVSGGAYAANLVGKSFKNLTKYAKGGKP